MAGTHPDELTLLDFVEGDLAGGRRAEISAHVDGCPVCADTVRRLEGGRALLRESTLLDPPADTRQAIMARLPEREVPRRATRFSVGRLVAVLAPVAAAAVLVGVVVVTDPSLGDGDAEEAAIEAEEGAAEERAGDDAAAGPPEALSQVPVRSVRGPASEVARELRAEGFDARVVDGAVHVEAARRAAVERALSARPDGRVTVLIVP